MRAVVQRVRRASVHAEGAEVARIGKGLCVLVGVSTRDGPEDAKALAEKLAGLRVFPDAGGKLNRSLLDVGGAVLVISQFTLYGEVRRGRRPSFTAAAPAQAAEPLMRALVEHLSRLGLDVATGAFGTHMEIDLVNEGPVTLVLETSGGRVR